MARHQPASGNPDPATVANTDPQATNENAVASTSHSYAYGSASVANPYRHCRADSHPHLDKYGDLYSDAHHYAYLDANADTGSSYGNALADSNPTAYHCAGGNGSPQFGRRF